MTKSERNPITFDSFVRGFLGVLLFAGIVMLLNRLSSVLVPFFLAWLIAYLMFPLVKFFQYRCHLKYRIVGILLSFLVVGLVLAGVFMLMVPPMVEESLRVKDLLVAYLSHSQLVNNIPDAIEDFVRSHLSVDDIKGIVTQDGFMDGVKATLPKVWDVITQSISVVSSMFSLTMVLLYTLFILLDYDVICRSWPGLIPERYRHFAVQLVADVEDGMNKYFRGQAMVALCVGVLFSIGFLIIGFPMAVGLGMFIGLLNMVPYLQLLGFVPTILLAIVKAADTGQNFWVILL
jgi:predicted PurR-regulated permease PerM